MRLKSVRKLSLLVIIFLFLAATFYFIQTDFLIIKKIDILSDNISCVDKAQVKSTLNFFGKNILSLDFKRREEALKSKFLCIKKIDFSRSFPDGLKINVFQRKAEIILVSLKEKFASDSAIDVLIDTPASQSADTLEGEEEYVVDNEGVIFSKNNGENLNKVYIANLSLGQKIDRNFVENLLKVFERLKTFAVNTDVSLVEKDNLIVINSKLKIILRIDREIDSQLAALQLILENAKIGDKEIEFIDLRFDKPVVRYGKR